MFFQAIFVVRRAVADKYMNFSYSSCDMCEKIQLNIFCMLVDLERVQTNLFLCQPKEKSPYVAVVLVFH